MKDEQQKDASQGRLPTLPNADTATDGEPQPGTGGQTSSQPREETSVNVEAGGIEEEIQDAKVLAAEVERLTAALAASERDAKANYDRFLRERAELENFKRRSLKERAETLKYASENLIRDMLPVIDNLERAITHAEQGGNGQSVAEGLSLVLKSLLDALERHGVKQLATKGESFDPAIHEAIAHIESESDPPNHVAEEYQKGYMLHGRLLRPAAVAVAKAPQTAHEKGEAGGEQVEKPGGDG